MTALIHDIGKILIPVEILNKPGLLSEVEMEYIKQHSQEGYNILKNIEFPWPVAEIVLQHHEKIDGSSYPNGLKGDEILLEARIICVADVIEAMSSHRPYRPSQGIEVALKEIENNKGTLYDDQVADVCLHLFRKLNYQFPQPEI
jgi:HD-GYP domain-containing protein (c-di-GMP phosphodiesterase class II)